MKKLLIFMLMLTAGGLVFAGTVTLDEAIHEIADYMKQRLEKGSVIVVSNIKSEYSGLSDYIIKSLTVELTSDGTFYAAERDIKTRDGVAKELQFQEDGYVPEDMQKRLGHEMSPDYVISGEIALVRNVYHLTVKANHIESMRIVQPHVMKIKKSDRSVTQFLPVVDVDDSWKQKRVYFGGRAGAVMNMFSLTGANSYYKAGEVERPQFSFNGAGQIAWQMGDWVSMQVEFIFFTSEMKWAYERDWQTVTASDIVAPLLFKPTFWVGHYFLVSPFIGPYLKFAWGSYEWKRVYYDAGSFNPVEGDVVFELLWGGSVGLDIGVKAGPGILFLDARYFFDLDGSRLGSGTTGELLYQQSAEKKSSVYRMHTITLSIGYTVGLGKER
ncbi:MAG: outer membrane beta-barrel protein [Treponema sp.]|jgi:hypothetical protein|nr:outer membrane beta-barrel protein [Treponema sp.]